MNEATVSSQSESKLTLKKYISYGCGDTACNVVFGMISTLLTLFYTDYAGVSVAVVGLVMLISRVFDGFSDVIMGVIVTKTKSKWGRARPWMLWMALPYAIGAVSLFLVPQSTPMRQFWYIFITYNLVTTVMYTAINVPYGTLSTRMTRSSHERDILSVFRMSMAPIGRILAVTFTMPVVKLFGDDQMAWVKAMSIWAAIAVVLLLICFKNCEETVHVEVHEKAVEKMPIGQNIKALVTNQYFWLVLILWTVTCVHGTIVGTSLPYYCKYLFKNDTWMYSFLYLAEAGTLVVGAICCPMLLKRFGKRQISLIGAIIAVVAHLAFVLNMKSFSWALITSIVRALGEAPLTAIVFGMMGDVIEFGQWKTHIRQEALIFGAGSMGFKLGTGITSAVLTRLLNHAGYISSTGAETIVQPDSALHMIQMIYMWGPVIVWMVAVVALILYKLDGQYESIMKDLQEREARGEM